MSASTPSRSWRLHGRPVRIADFRQPATELPSLPHTQPEAVEAEPSATYRLCDRFPADGETFEGGSSDGHCFRLAFRSANRARCLEMIRHFLHEQGFGQLPLPHDYDELKAFRLPRNERRQLRFFQEDGYVHNPIKILFPPPGSELKGLVLEVYNQEVSGHLLRFHGRG